MTPVMRDSEPIRGRIRENLLRWYGPNGRDLPWRRRRDPYAVWVSEIMLQQTQARTVESYFGRFLLRFPDLEALAQARLDDVLKAWEGLGYYGRARNLHRTAKLVRRHYGGRLPATAEELAALPGIGPYTAGAIASLAFGRDEPVLDGNVIRVLTRLFLIRDDVTRPRTRNRLWRLAGRLLPVGRAGQFNEALMDLGALVCTPRQPGCPRCPVRKDCRALTAGRQLDVPVRKRRKPLPHHQIAIGIIWRGELVLIDRRKPEGLLGGLWEFPGGKCEPGESLADCVAREVREELGIQVSVGKELMTVRHAYTHFRVTLHAFVCRYVGGRARAIGCYGLKWVRMKELERFAFPAANRRIIDALREGEGRA